MKETSQMTNGSEIKAYLIQRDHDQITLRQILSKTILFVRYLLSNYILVGVMTLGFVCVGIIESMLQKKRFIASATFLIQQQNLQGSAGGYSNLASQYGIKLGTSSNDNDVFSETNLREFMVSRTVLQTVLSSKVVTGTRKSNFALFYIGGEPITEGKTKLNLRMFSDTTEKISRIRDSILGQLCDDIRSNNIKIEKSPNSDFLKIDCRSGNETFSKMFLLKLLDEVSTTYIGTKTEKIRSIIKILKKKADSSKAVLDDLLLSKAYVQDQNLYTTRSVINVPIQKKEIQLKKIENEYLELEKNIEVQQYQLLQNTPLIKVVDPPMYPLATEKLGKMKGAIVGGLIGLFLITLALLFTFMTKNKDKYELN